MRWKSAFSLVVILVVSAAVGQRLRIVRDAPPVPLLKGRLVTPKPGSDGLFDLAPGRPILATFEIENAGRLPVTGLTVETGCRCHIKHALPAVLQPGKTARLVVHVPPPPAGFARREIPVYADGQSTALLLLSVAMRVRVTTPSWIAAPKAVSLSAVSGQRTRQEIVWDAVERPDESTWIEDVRLEPSELAEFGMTVDQQPWGEDGKYCLRKYRFRFLF